MTISAETPRQSLEEFFSIKDAINQLKREILRLFLIYFPFLKSKDYESIHANDFVLGSSQLQKDN